MSMKAQMPPRLLGFGNDVLAEGGFAGGLGAVDFDDAAARHAAHAQRDVKGHRAGGDVKESIVLSRVVRRPSRSLVPFVRAIMCSCRIRLVVGRVPFHLAGWRNKYIVAQMFVFVKMHFIIMNNSSIIDTL
jgi:hypothetical protein